MAEKDRAMTHGSTMNRLGSRCRNACEYLCDTLKAMGNGRSVFNAKRHEHKLRYTEGLPPYKCSGCKGRGANIGYKCRLCPEFVLHKICFSLRDEFVHPFFPKDPFTFRATTHLRHNCDACGVLIRGFLFESSRGKRIHPLCLRLPDHFRHSGHADHDLRLINQDGGNHACTWCGKENTNWKYRCSVLDCRSTLDMNCAIIDIHRLSQHGIAQVYKPSQTQRAFRMVATAVTVVCTPLLGVAGTAVINREVNQGQGN